MVRPTRSRRSVVELGAEVIAIGVEPDGFNINKECGSPIPRLYAPRCARCAPMSYCARRDADRVVMVDERGGLIDGDQLMAVIAESWKEMAGSASPASSQP